MIAAQGVSLQYGGRVLFNDVNINFHKGQLLWTDWCQRCR